MATFTMNSQRNFVQSAPPNSIFDKAFVFSIALVLLVGGAWGAEYLMIYLTEKKTVEYQAATAASLEALNAKDVQAVHDVTSRLAAVEKYGATRLPIDEILASLEKSTIPQVTLTKYEYMNDGSVTISGTVADYRFLAEQILRYRQDPILMNAEVTNTDRSDSGQVVFDIQAQPAGAVASPTT